MDRRRFLTAVTAAVALPALELDAMASSKTSLIGPGALLATARVPGLAICGTLRRKIVNECFGEAATEKHVPVTEHTIFPAASMTKALFSFAVRRLARTGGFNLEAPLVEYGDVGISGVNAEKITARHVLTHTSGLPNWLFDARAPLEPQSQPGTRWRYSGEGFVALQRAIEKAMKQPIAVYMDTVVLPSLGMRESTVVWKPDLQSKSAVGYESELQPMQKSLTYYAEATDAAFRKVSFDPATGTTEEALKALSAGGQSPLRILITPNMAGSLWTTPVDFARLAHALLADAKQHRDEYQPTVEAQGIISWGLAGAVDRSLGNAIFQYGDGPGYKNLLWLSPAEETALAFFTNGERGAHAYSWALRQRIGRDPAALYWV